MESKKKYTTEEERKQHFREYMKKWRNDNLEKAKEIDKKTYFKNREKKISYQRNYYENHKIERKTYVHSPIGRAQYLLCGYKREDKKYDRGESDLTAKWIVENIFSKPCAYCGKIGWDVIGCNRLDNSKPHTMDNVEPCCCECNLELVGHKSKKVYQYTLDGELMKVYNSVKECGRNGFNSSHISECCLGKQKTHKGFKWSYEPFETN